MRKTLAAAAAVAAATTSVVLLPAGAAAAAGDTATVSVLHAVPGLTVDVYANGEELIGGFEPGTLTDPQQLPAGSYDLAVLPAGSPATDTPAISADDVAVPAGANVTVVAHLGADGQPRLTPYVNDVSAVPAGQARLTVRHTAAAPAVDVRAGGQPVVTGLTNPGEDSLAVPAGAVSADVVLAGTTTPVIGPADLTLGAGTSTIVYAWGSAQAGNLALAVQRVDDLGGSPSGVSAGSGGMLDADVPTWVLASSAAGLALAAGAGVLLARRRRHIADPASGTAASSGQVGTQPRR